jgi:hypothetical protein
MPGVHETADPRVGETSQPFQSSGPSLSSPISKGDHRPYGVEKHPTQDL